MSAFRRIALFVAAVALADHAAAGTINGIGLVNQSDPDTAVSSAGERLVEFRTQAFTPAAATGTGNTSSFTNRFAWMSAHRVLPGGFGASPFFGNTVAYDLVFTIEDPTSQGYVLSFESLFRGYVTSEWDFAIDPGPVVAAGTPMAAQLDSGSGFSGFIPELATTFGTATATFNDTFENVLVSNAGSYQAGTFFGTQTFQLRFTSLIPNTQAAIAPFNGGEADVRFGLDPTLAGFANAVYPGIDGETPDLHGHFVTVNATFLTAAVPEPDARALMGLGLALCAAARKLRPARAA
jgi:hypothetical protein